jgi:hypothetical protein
VVMEVYSGYGSIQWLLRYTVVMEVYSGYGGIQWLGFFFVKMW